MTTRSLVSALAKITPRLAGRFAVVLLTAFSFAQSIPVQPGYPANQAGRVLVSSYANWNAQAINAVAAGAQSMTLSVCTFPVGSNNRFAPFGSIIATNVPLQIFDGASSEIVTPTAVTTPTAAGPSAVNPLNCGFTATFVNAHSVNVRIGSGDNGFMEAANDAASLGAGTVSVDNYSGATAANISGANVTGLPGSMIVEYTKADLTPPRWTIQPTTLTALATPATRSAAAGNTQVISGTAVGTWTAVPIYVCVTYVDMLGGESPCSLTYNFTATVSVALNFASPAASTGAVGWRAYAGATSLSTAYQLPISSSTCTLTTLETVLPACAIGSAGVFPTPTTTTQLAPVAGGVAAVYAPNTQSHTTFGFVPSGAQVAGIQNNYGPFVISPALTAGQLVNLGVVSLPAGFLNYIGRTIRVSGRLTVTASTGGTDQIIVAIGDLTDFSTGTPKAVCTETETTAITTAAQTQYFQCTWTTNATGVTGSIMPGGFACLQLGAGTTAAACSVESATAAITADVLDQDQVFIDFLQTSAAETTTPPHLMDLHVEVL